MIEHHSDSVDAEYFAYATGFRPEYELYNAIKDKDCLNNLSGLKTYKKIEKRLRKNLEAELKSSKDPRFVGSDKDIFDSYIRYSKMRYYPGK